MTKQPPKLRGKFFLAKYLYGCFVVAWYLQFSKHLTRGWNSKIHSVSIKKTIVWVLAENLLTPTWNIFKSGFKGRLKKSIFWHFHFALSPSCIIPFPWTQDLSWTYIRCSEDVLDVLWTSYVRSICVICSGGSMFFSLTVTAWKVSKYRVTSGYRVNYDKILAHSYIYIYNRFWLY